MNEKLPSVKDEELSNIRKEHVLEAIQRGFDKNVLGRKIVNFREIPLEELGKYTDKKFFKIGLASITDKIWFVDMPNEKTYYSYQGMGYEYGMAVAEGETNGIIKEIIKNVKPENKIQLKRELKKEDTILAFEKLFHSRNTNRLKGNILVTNLYDEHAFWLMDGFEPVKSLEDKSSLYDPYGFINVCGRKIPVFASRVVPKGITLLFDKDSIGTLLIKKPLQKAIEDVGKLSEDKKDKIIRDIPTLAKEQLYEKVEVTVYEVVIFELEDTNAVILLEHEIKEE